MITTLVLNIQMNTLAKRLEILLKFRGLKQEQLANIVNVSQGTISKIARGESKRSRYLIEICQVLDCDSEWLLTGKGPSPMGAMADLYKKIPEGQIPVIEWNQAAQWSIESEDAINFSGKTLPSPCPERRNKNIFALRVKGDSMIGKNMAFVEGSYIIVDPDQGHKEGDYVVAIKSGAREAVFRQLITESGNDILVPLNPQYKTIEEGFDIIGVVVVHQNYL